MSDNKCETNNTGIDLSSLQNTDFSSLMSNVMQNVDMDKFKSVLTSLNMNNESMDKIVEAVSSPSPENGAANLDMGQLNSLASNVLKNMDVTKLQSVVSNMAGDNANAINGLIGSLMSNVKETATPTATSSNMSGLAGMLGSLLSGGKAAQGQCASDESNTQNVQNILGKFKPPVDLGKQPMVAAMGLGGSPNDLKSQLNSLIGTMNLDPSSKEKISNTFEGMMTRPMVSMDSIKNGIGGINLQQLGPILSSLMENMTKPQK